MGRKKGSKNKTHPKLKAKKSRLWSTYHGRRGRFTIHFSQPVSRPTMKRARPYVMVRKEGGGTERLYLDTKRASEISGITNLRKEAINIKREQMQKLTS